MLRFSWLGLFLLVFTLFGCKEATQLPSPFHATNVSRSEVMSFSLTDQAGKVRNADEFKGKVTVVFFGYTHCPEICPSTLADMTLLLKKLGDQAKQVQVLLVTVDPERDTSEQLQQYLAAFDPSIVGLTGDEAAIAAFAKQFGVTYSKQPLERGYFMDHTTNVFVVDQKGRLRLQSPHAQNIEWLAEDVGLLLKGV